MTSWNMLLWLISNVKKQESFPNLSKAIDPDEVELEFMRFQTEELPDNIINCERMDAAWNLVGKLKFPQSETLKYSHLAKVMLTILVLPHSNAECECSVLSKETKPTLSLICLREIWKTSLYGKTMSNKGTPCYKLDFARSFEKGKTGHIYGLKKTNHVLICFLWCIFFFLAKYIILFLLLYVLYCTTVLYCSLVTLIQLFICSLN